MRRTTGLVRRAINRGVRRIDRRRRSRRYVTTVVGELIAVLS